MEYSENFDEIKALWLQTFELKSLDEIYIPKHDNAIKCALQGKEVHLTNGSLKKLVQKNRAQYIPQIRDVLDMPDAIIRHDGSLIFTMKLNERIDFTSVGWEFNEKIVIVSNAPKRKRTMINKLKNGEFVYQSPKFEKLRYNQTFTDERSNHQRD